MSEKNKVFILKGAPGVGKSFISRKLISKLNKKKIALISVDELLHLDTRSLCQDKLKLAKFHAAILVRSFLREGFDIVVEYCFDIQSHLKFFWEKIQSSHVEVIPEADIFIFHLEADIPTLLERNKTRRDGSDPMPVSVLKKLAEDCEKTAGKMKGEIVVSTTKVSPAKVVDFIMSQIQR